MQNAFKKSLSTVPSKTTPQFILSAYQLPNAVGKADSIHGFGFGMKCSFPARREGVSGLESQKRGLGPRRPRGLLPVMECSGNMPRVAGTNTLNWINSGIKSHVCQIFLNSPQIKGCELAASILLFRLGYIAHFEFLSGHIPLRSSPHETSFSFISGEISI